MCYEFKVYQDKILTHLQSEVLDGWLPCNDIKTLETYGIDETQEKEEGVHVKDIQKIPAALIERVLGTCEAYPTMEIGFVIYRNFLTGEWDIRAPEQKGTGVHVSFFEEKHPDAKFQVAGTIHTHPNMGAFWSGTDMNDQGKKPGMIHWVFGLRGGLVDQYKCSYFHDDGTGKSICYDFELLDLLEEKPDFKKHRDPDPEWKAIIDKQSYKVPEAPKAFKPITLIGGKSQSKSTYIRDAWDDWDEWDTRHPRWAPQITSTKPDKADKKRDKQSNRRDADLDSLLDDLGDTVAEMMYAGLTSEEIMLRVAETCQDVRQDMEVDAKFDKEFNADDDDDIEVDVDGLGGPLGFGGM